MSKKINPKWLGSKIDKAIERFRSYIKDEKEDQVFFKLSGEGVGKTTFRNWIVEPEKIRTAHLRETFIAVMSTLPDLDAVKRHQAYDFALEELDVGLTAQSEFLKSYSGQYDVEHKFHNVELHNFIINVEHDPFAAFFAFRYRLSDNFETVTGKCDGVVVSRNGQFICSGMSRTTVFLGIFGGAAYPDQEPIRGKALIADLTSKNMQFSDLSIKLKSIAEGAQNEKAGGLAAPSSDVDQ